MGNAGVAGARQAGLGVVKPYQHRRHGDGYGAQPGVLHLPQPLQPIDRGKSCCRVVAGQTKLDPGIFL